MNGKVCRDCGPLTASAAADDIRAEILNPFVHNVELDTTLDKIKTAIFTVVLLPFRVMVICWLLVTAWMLACVGLYGLTEQDLRSKPMTGWRRWLRARVCALMRAVFAVSGFSGVRVRGVRQARSRDAPVLCVAPHSSFFDSIMLVYLGAPSVVAKADTARLPLFGQLINYTQPVYVWRDDPNSRQNTIKEIIERATSDDWPQILIFPEGTCTNRSCLITFKPGGFYPGVPVQPVTIRYPNHLDTVTWTWEGPSALKLLWLTLTRVHTACEIEFLPVYRPNEQEKQDPKLYASNVRNVMAKALGIPVSDYTYDDCRLVWRAKQLNIPHATSLVEAQKLRQALGLESSRLECHLLEQGGNRAKIVGVPQHVHLAEFCKRLGIKETEPTAQSLFSIFEEKQSGLVDWKNYLLSAVFLSNPSAPTSQILMYGFHIYDESGEGRLNEESVKLALSHCAGLSHEEGSAAFLQTDMDERGWVTADEFFDFAQKKVEFTFLFNLEDTVGKTKTN
ncbi:lysophosphatidylcholine acyltransferase-like [Arctopsyche grandis]|uniref:lysophosphatidylcholine acyltransferase-like n=1 Tax=Arctopsyche grandis TaxID=121162 RepID=UPI00406D6674